MFSSLSVIFMSYLSALCSWHVCLGDCVVAGLVLTAKLCSAALQSVHTIDHSFLAIHSAGTPRAQSTYPIIYHFILPHSGPQAATGGFGMLWTASIANQRLPPCPHMPPPHLFPQLNMYFLHSRVPRVIARWILGFERCIKPRDVTLV